MGITAAKRSGLPPPAFASMSVAIRPGATAINAHAMSGVFYGGRACQGNHRRFCCGIQRHTHCRIAYAGRRCIVNDDTLPLFQHLCQFVLHAQKNAAYICVKNRVELMLVLFCQRRDRSEPSSIVECNIEASKRFNRCVDQRAHRCWSGDIGRNEQRRSTHCPDCGDRRFTGVTIPIADDYARAVPAERQRCCAPDS